MAECLEPSSAGIDILTLPWRCMRYGAAKLPSHSLVALPSPNSVCSPNSCMFRPWQYPRPPPPNFACFPYKAEQPKKCGFSLRGVLDEARTSVMGQSEEGGQWEDDVLQSPSSAPLRNVILVGCRVLGFWASCSES